MGPTLPLMRVEDARTATVLLHPTRSRILARLREPASASQVARMLGLPPAQVNHHVHRLREVGLVRPAGRKRVRNLVERLYRASARTYVISEEITPGGEWRRLVRSEPARRGLRNLVALGERLAGDALVLLDQAAWEDREFSTYATSVDLAFPDAGARAAFLADLLQAVRALREKYGADEDAPPGGRYKTVIACYPETRE